MFVCEGVVLLDFSSRQRPFVLYGGSLRRVRRAGRLIVKFLRQEMGKREYGLVRPIMLCLQTVIQLIFGTILRSLDT